MEVVPPSKDSVKQYFPKAGTHTSKGRERIWGEQHNAGLTLTPRCQIIPLLGCKSPDATELPEGLFNLRVRLNMTYLLTVKTVKSKQYMQYSDAVTNHAPDQILVG